MSKRLADFSIPVKDLLAKRVGYLCSNPACRIPTIGPSSETSKTTLIGVAAHITAASPGGARYDESLSITERQDYSNGIWLCSNHARLIDVDQKSYTVELLIKWRNEAEDESRHKLTSTAILPQTHVPILEADLIGRCTTRTPIGLSEKNPKEFHHGQWVYVGNIPVNWWRLGWSYKLVIYNNSSFNAYNIRVENIGSKYFSEVESLTKFVSLGSLSNLNLNIKHYEMVEGIYTVADARMNKPFPEDIENIMFRIHYQNEERKNFTTLVKFQDDEVFNKREQY